jgi:hypothetical protein
MAAAMALVLPSCQGQAIKDKGPAFYYWRTQLNFDTANAALAEQMKNQHLYLRYFDVDWSAGYEAAVPRGAIDLDYGVIQGWDKKTITPCIYITNRTFERLPETGMEELVSKVLRKVEQLNKSLVDQVFGYAYYDSLPDNLTWEEKSDIIDSLETAYAKKMTELQIDCDWTAKTRDRYFQFLNQLIAKSPELMITCTLRLHQYRDRKLMGIPPVEKLMLMCYNTGDPKKLNENNAILDAEVVKQYLKGKKYPRQLELALPHFSWGAWYRAGSFQGLLREFNPSASYVQLESNNRYRVSQDTVVGQDYLREGDLIRLDGPTAAQMQATLQTIKERLGRRFSRLAFFDWEYRKVKASQAELSTYFQTLQKN